MATRVIPSTIDPTGKVDVSAQLAAFLATVKSGDVVQAPANATYLHDKQMELNHAGVNFFWNGATFKHTSARPFGALRTDVTISGGKTLTTKVQLPTTCNWGYVSGPGIPNGTQMTFSSTGGRKVANLSGVCTDGTNLTVTFTSKADRNRAGFNITGTDLELHDATWVGANPTSLYISNLEAQHGVNFAGATGVKLENINSNHMFGDGIYLTSTPGGHKTTFVDAVGGTIDYNGRSGIVPAICSDISISGYTIGHVRRTALNFEPAASSFMVDRFSLSDSDIGSHQLNLISSGGNADAHIGAINFSGNRINSSCSMWLTVGNSAHRRGPYTVTGNTCTWAGNHGTSYPTAAVICVSNAVSATIKDNVGFKLQTRWPIMALVRYKNSGPVVVSGNQFTGNGPEVGPWI